jgi:predicted nicotinamide N-methyase
VVFANETLIIAWLNDPDKVIDEMFAHLERLGAPDLLKEYTPYFACLWPAATALCRELATIPLAGKTLLEIGCGLAIPGMLAARRGARVTVSDVHPDVGRLLDLNLSLNPGIKNLKYLAADWPTASLSETFDIICGSDILYDREGPEAVAAFCQRHAGSTTEVIITDPGRPYARDLHKAMRAAGFDLARRSCLHTEDGILLETIVFEKKL